MGGGKTTVNDAVFQSIAEIVLKNINDVVAKERKGPLAGFSKKLIERFSPQVIVKKVEAPEVDFGEISFELRLAVIYGIKIPEVATRIRKELVEVVKEFTGYQVTQVDVVVDRIVEMKDLEPEMPKEE
ncbi:MAG: Asp23/Gls24 family envelope stress response protein [Dethiobacter sp.]|jgi:uncharacterized alkaline shock family protein YloU|nr:MAG: Asp23/Gls24 family envelope stress response protein [Dethiobacter sp.]